MKTCNETHIHIKQRINTNTALRYCLSCKHGRPMPDHDLEGSYRSNCTALLLPMVTTCVPQCGRCGAWGEVGYTMFHVLARRRDTAELLHLQRHPPHSQGPNDPQIMKLLYDTPCNPKCCCGTVQASSLSGMSNARPWQSVVHIQESC